MSIGMISLVALSMLILFGVLQRVLDRMALTDRQALFCVVAVFIGGWLPDLDLGGITLNLGGAIVPAGVCVYLFLNAETSKERIRTIVSSIITAAVIYGISLFFPADPVTMPFDPMILYGISGGIIAWFLGRSRRCSFIAGTAGMILSDLFVGIRNWLSGLQQTVHLGSAGALDATVLSGITAVLMCEFFGELIERIQTGKAAGKNEDGAIEGGERA